VNGEEKTMSGDWTIDGPRVLDIGDDGERVRRLTVSIVGGRVDVVTHDDSPTARLEVTSVEGMPLRVRWDGAHLRVTQDKDGDGTVVDWVKRMTAKLEKNRAVVSLSVPEDATTSVNTVSAGGLLAGLRAPAKVNTVSGSITLDDIVGPVDVNTVSGEVECGRLRGPLKVHSVSGAVTAQQSDIPAVSINTVSGDVTLDLLNAAGQVNSNSVSGDVTLRAPHGGYDVVANTASGQVVIDGVNIDKRSRPAGVRLTDGDGALRLKANAVSGNVVVLRARSNHSDEAPAGAVR
jgi:DUF4097 and DUF4098 domain-containing protein YvlB